jgi:hypothetical protein
MGKRRPRQKAMNRSKTMKRFPYTELLVGDANHPDPTKRPSKGAMYARDRRISKLDKIAEDAWKGVEVRPIEPGQEYHEPRAKPGTPEPKRKQLYPDYSTSLTPKHTDPLLATIDRLTVVSQSDFYQGIDEYHRIIVRKTDLERVYLMFHASHFFFIKHDLVKNKAWMSSDFRERRRAMYCLETNHLSWVQEVPVSQVVRNESTYGTHLKRLK